MGHRLSSAPAAALLAGLCLAGGCGAAGRAGRVLDAWVVNEMATLTDRTPRTDDPLIFEPDYGTVNLFGAGNETVCFQLVVDAGAEAIEQLQFACSDLVSDRGERIAASNIRAFRMLPVKVRRYPPWYLRLVDEVPAPAGFYDPLVPVDAPGASQPYDLPPGGRLALWIDVSIPRGARPGLYLGTAWLSAAPSRRWAAAVKLKVYDLVLPDTQAVAAVGGFDHRDLYAALVRDGDKPFVPLRLDPAQPLVRRGLVILRQLMRVAHEHRLDLFDKAVRPVLKRGRDGVVRLDWSHYDAVVRPYLDGTAFEDRIGVRAWASPVSAAWPDPNDYGGAETKDYVRTLQAAAAAAGRHFRAIGAARRIFYWPCRGPIGPAAYGRYVRLARLIRAADPGSLILSRLPPDPPEPTGWAVPRDLGKWVDLHVWPGQWFDPGRAGQAGKAETGLTRRWVSPGRPPYFPSLGVIAAAADVRAIPWLAMKYGRLGVFLPDVLNWTAQAPARPAGAEPPAAVALARTRLFYPGTRAGTEGVLASVRLKRLRRGLQDAAYLAILQQRGRAGVARALIDGLARYAGLAAAGDHYLDPRLDGWVKDGPAWETARRILAEEVELAVHPDRPAGRGNIARRVLWRTFDEKTGGLRVERVRSRVTILSPGEGAEQARLRATLILELWNADSRPTDVTVKIAALPAGWKAVTGEVKTPGVAPGRRLAVALSAEGRQVPPSWNGKLPMPVTLTAGRAAPRTLNTAACFLTAGKAPRAPKIDGILRDWPMRPGNTASGFRLLGRRGRAGTLPAERQTQAFVLNDERNLYIAIRCMEPDPGGVVARSDNIVRYEQLMACGEDLVEILLDPGAKGRGPEDLYHIVVKANGVVVAERGVRTDPPLGRAAPWAAGIAAAVARNKTDWIVELAVPLSSFGAAGGAPLWGVNFARFATKGAESSSWSGAARYFYHPKNLGTMRLGGPRGR